MLLVSHAIGLIPDAGSLWANLRMGEFKAMVALAAKDHELSRAGVEWCLHFAPLEKSRRLLYLCLATLLEVEMDDTVNENDYLPTVTRMYGKDLVEKAQSLIRGSLKFDALTESDANLSGFEMHGKLLESYEKLQKAKRSWWEKKNQN